MGERTQRVKGKANEVAGKAKAEAGRMKGDGSTETKGASQATKGKAQQTVGKARSAVKKATARERCAGGRRQRSAPLACADAARPRRLNLGGQLSRVDWRQHAPARSADVLVVVERQLDRSEAVVARRTRTRTEQPLPRSRGTSSQARVSAR